MVVMEPRTPLRNPAYFARSDRPSLLIGTAVVVAEATLTALLVRWFLRALLARVDIPPEAVRGAVESVPVVTFLSIVGGWLLVAALFHVILLLLSEPDRPFGTTLAVVGEAELVSLLLLPVTAVGLHLLVGQVPADPEAAVAFLQGVPRSGSPLLILTSLVRAVWTAAIQSVGLADAHGVSLGGTFALTFGFGLLGFLLTLL